MLWKGSEGLVWGVVMRASSRAGKVCGLLGGEESVC